MLAHPGGRDAERPMPGWRSQSGCASVVRMLYNLIIGVIAVVLLFCVLGQIFEAESYGDPYAVYGAIWGSPLLLAFFGWMLEYTSLYWWAGGFLVFAILSVPFMVVKWLRLAPERRQYRL